MTRPTGRELAFSLYIGLTTWLSIHTIIGWMA